MTPLFDRPVFQAVIAIGSNTDSELAFLSMKNELLKLGEFILSETIIGKDFTHKTENIYHNACLILKLNCPLLFNDLNQTLKKIEIVCGRKKESDKVAMDLDILAINHDYDNGKWHIIPKRLPFKQHEKTGLLQIAPFLLEDD